MILDKQDLKVAGLLVDVWNAFLESELDLDDVSDFRFHINALQNILASRAVHYDTGLFFYQLEEEEEPEIYQLEEKEEPAVEKEVVPLIVEPKVTGKLVVALAEGEVGYVLEDSFVRIALTNAICIRNDAIVAPSTVGKYNVPIKRAGRAFLTARMKETVKNVVSLMDNNLYTSVYWALGT